MGEWKLFPRTMAWRRCWIVMCLLLWQPVVVSPLSLRSVQWQTKSSSSNSTKPKLQESATAISVPVPQTRRQTTSSNCKSFRPMEDYYTAELQLYYVYWVEFAASAKSRSLAGLEAAITSSIANAFVDFCDVLDRPMVKVKANMRHQFSKDGKW